MFKINKRFALLAAILMVTGSYFIHDVYRATTAMAQACLNIRPLFFPGSTTLNSGGTCVQRNEVINVPGAGGMVLMTGWRLNYTTSNDHEVETLRAQVQANVANNPSFFSFTVSACLNDRNDDDAYSATVDWLAVRWR